MKQQTDADVIIFVSRYKRAGVSEIESVIKDYLAKADGYEQRGWGRYGAPGWIDDLRSACEARLAAFYKATGKDAAYQTYVDRAIAHRKRAHPGTNPTAEDLCGFVEKLDAANIQPRWRKEVGSSAAPSANSHFENARKSER